jgi:hypothetical protein
MARRLLDQQISLLQYLTSAAAIRGDRETPGSPVTHGMDLGLVHLEARLSHEKRMQRIGAALPRTFALLGNAGADVSGDFAEACPPTASNGLEDAKCFGQFLAARRDHEGHQPYWCDVAGCELAGLSACAIAQAQEKSLVDQTADGPQLNRRFRRRRGVVLLRCAYDVRPCFEGAPGDFIPAKRDLALAITASRSTAEPRAMELHPFVFDLLVGCDDWTDLSALDRAPIDEEVVRELMTHRLIEFEACGSA